MPLLKCEIKHLRPDKIAFQKIKVVRLGVFELSSVDFWNWEAGFNDKAFELDFFLVAFLMREGQEMQVSGEFLAHKFVEEHFVD